jgi:uncharacterized surface protein with fasciclin (FAS1) repeats
MRNIFIITLVAAVGASCAPNGTETGDQTAADVVMGQESEEIHLGYGNVYQVLEERENLGLLNDALRATKLGDELAEGGPYTVFAPTNDAFEKLAPLAINNLPDDTSQDELKQILLRHVVEGEYTAADLVNMDELPTLGGVPLVISTANDRVMVNGADVILADQQADNGYVHLIDSVLVGS